jgi:tripartite-type tricarboxylate transporter receptor subunit TctC
MKSRLRILFAALAAAAMIPLCAAQTAPAATAAISAYPAKPVRIVIGFPPGGGTDMLARFVAHGFTEEFKQPFVVENKPGASTLIAADHVAKSAPDGYTLLVSSSSAMTISPLMNGKMPFSAERDFQPITSIGSFPLVLLVNPAVEAKSVRELVDLSKRDPKGLNYASGSVGFQLSVEMFKQMSGANLYHVPYKGSVQMLTALLGGDVQTAIVDLTAVVPHITAGKLRPLALTSAARSPIYPDLPTIAESGYPGYEFGLWMALFAPAGTPPAIVEKLQAAVAKMVKTPQARARLAAIGVEPSGNTPAQLADMVKAERTRYAPILKQSAITAD